MERRTEDVTQEMDLTKYRWKLENDPVYEYTETFIKTGPNTFETGEPAHPTVFTLQWIFCPAAQI